MLLMLLMLLMQTLLANFDAAVEKKVTEPNGFYTCKG